MALARIPPAALMRSGNPQDPRSQRTRSALLEEFERQLDRGGVQPSVASLIRGASVSRSAFYAHFASIDEVHIAAVRAVLETFGPSAAKHPAMAPGPGPARVEVETTSRSVSDAVRGAASGGAGAGAASSPSPSTRGAENTDAVSGTGDEPANPSGWREGEAQSLIWLPYEELFKHLAAHRSLFTTVLPAEESPVTQLQRALVDQCRRAVERAPLRPAGIDSSQAAEFIVGGVLACTAHWLADPEPCSAAELAAQVTSLMPRWLQDEHGARTTVEVAIVTSAGNPVA